MTARKLVKSPQCLVCRHPDRALLELERVAGTSLDHLAAKYKISRDAIWRHEKNHLTDDDRARYLAQVPLQDLATKAAAESVSVLGFFQIVRAALMSEFQLAASIHDRVAMSSLASRLTEVLRSIGSLTGEMSNLAANSITINNTTLINSPIFANLQASILTALAPYPEARAAVVNALRSMDEENAPPMKIIEHIPAAESVSLKGADHVPGPSSAR